MGINISSIQSSNQQIPEIPLPIEYMKGRVKTRSLVQADRGCFLGEGSFGKVFVDKKDKTRAIKKSFAPMTNEYYIGKTLNHKNFVTIHALFIKHYPNSGYRDKHKLVMDRIIGKTLEDIPPRSIPLSQGISIIEEAIDSCLYLFDNKICWQDIHSGNAYLLKGSNQLLLADFGFWESEEIPTLRAQNLLRGLSNLVYEITRLCANLNAEQKKRFEEVLDQRYRINWSQHTTELQAREQITSFARKIMQVFVPANNSR